MTEWMMNLAGRLAGAGSCSCASAVVSAQESACSWVSNGMTPVNLFFAVGLFDLDEHYVLHPLSPPVVK